VQPTGGIRPDLQAFFGCRACRDTGFGFFLLTSRIPASPDKVPAGRRKIAVKVVDIFGNDIMKILDVTVTGEQWQFIPRFLQEAKIPQKDFFPAFHVTLEVDK
jgi:hypothetical protein